ncbi:Monoterpene epsilon-lactone hydrolase [Diplonema papillatum]|nr:Monoterpene epsilon-lactone hydrolase [Diplonema papillatum]
MTATETRISAPSSGSRSDDVQVTIERIRSCASNRRLAKELARPALSLADAWVPTSADLARLREQGAAAVDAKMVSPKPEHEEEFGELVRHCVSVFRGAMDGGDTGMDDTEHPSVTVLPAEHPVVAPWTDEQGNTRGQAEWILPAGLAPDEDMPYRVLYVHGGGYQYNAPDDGYRPLTTRITAYSGLPLFAFDYRKAPHFRFPAPLEDTIEALRHVWHYDAAGNFSPAEKVFMVGDSAGAGLAFSVVVNLTAARKEEARLLLPTALAVISAYTDLSCSLPSYKSRVYDPETMRGDPLFSTNAELAEEDTEQNRALGHVYMANDCIKSLKHPIASTAFAPDHVLGHDTFPPVLMQVGNEELMLDDTVFLYLRLQGLGATAELEVYDRMWHDWVLYVDSCGFGKDLSLAKRAISSLARFMNSFLPDEDNNDCAG